MGRAMGLAAVVVAIAMMAGCAQMGTAKSKSVYAIMSEIQEQITWQVWNANGWAANPVVVNAVIAQNKKGPIPGMDNAKWKMVPGNDAIVQGFINDDAAKFLKEEMGKTDGICTGGFLNAAQGEKVAFTGKTSSYIHKGSAKFDVPFTTGKPWQGKPELDDSGKAYEIQISVPVLSEGKPVGALVVDLDGTKLEEMARK
ncbi:MAG TPA: hypothetical protein VLT62_26960 [Candidatus Methylomirabilis sp.]|nr:hypothetical protein [Candidatus Methylomirabilis sp.]